MDNKYDVAIIGSGLGGLVCGYILSRNGYKVVVFEKNEQIGGCLQTFNRFGIKFETGMHYIGSMDEGQILNRFFKYLSLNEDVKLSRLDPDGYDEVSIGGKRYKLASGYDNFVNVLSEQFPDERENLKRYVKEIRAIANSSPLYRIEVGQNPIGGIGGMSASDFIDSITSNETLRKVLVGNILLYAGVKKKTPLYLHALINDFYINSAFRIVGGSDIIANSLCNSIKKMGGSVFNNSFVESIVCDNTKATSVDVKGIGRFDIDYVISAIHPCATLDKLNSPLIRNVYRNRITQQENTTSVFTVYIKFKPGTTPYLNRNFYHYNCEDVWGCEDYKSLEDWPKGYFFLHQCCEENQEYAKGAELMAYMNYEDVAQWHGTDVNRRGDDYKLFKQKMAKKLISNLEQQFPGISKNIERYETSTPLTYESYTSTKRGSIYGILRDVNSINGFCSQRTKIPNLFLTGQNINSHGILGVIIGSIITCSELTGLERIIKQIKES